MLNMLARIAHIRVWIEQESQTNVVRPRLALHLFPHYVAERIDVVQLHQSCKLPMEESTPTINGWRPRQLPLLARLDGPK